MDISNVFSLQNIFVYLVIINIIAFLAMCIDKRRSKKGQWRIQEKTLFMLVALGGGVGGIAGMYMFRHKTQKVYFKIGFPAILIAEIVAVIWYIISK